MAFEEREISRTLGEPINLYLFEGTGDDIEPFFAELESTVAIGPYAYTDAETSITLDGVVYEPVPISRDPISASGNLDKALISVRTAQTTELSSLFLAYPPSQVVNLIIRQGHVGDELTLGNFPAVWVGRVLGAQHPPNETVFNCEPISTSMQRPGLRRNWQLPCPHVLYGPSCKASLNAATVTSEPTLIVGNKVTLPGGWNTEPVDKYKGGLARWTHPDGNLIMRTVIGIEGGVTLTLGGPVSGLEVGQDFMVSLGCNHLAGLFDANGDCKNLHDNILNFGGQPFIPLTNPFSSINNFY